jgi:hypothetical protein
MRLTGTLPAVSRANFRSLGRGHQPGPGPNCSPNTLGTRLGSLLLTENPICIARRTLSQNSGADSACWQADCTHLLRPGTVGRLHDDLIALEHDRLRGQFGGARRHPVDLKLRRPRVLQDIGHDRLARNRRLRRREELKRARPARRRIELIPDISLNVATRTPSTWTTKTGADTTALSPLAAAAITTRPSRLSYRG